MFTKSPKIKTNVYAFIRKKKNLPRAIARNPGLLLAAGFWLFVVDGLGSTAKKMWK